VPRREQATIGNVKRDPVELLEINSTGQIERLVPLLYGRMIESPFTFYRGSAIIQAHNLAGTPNSGLIMQICGDCHLASFGGFRRRSPTQECHCFENVQKVGGRLRLTSLTYGMVAGSALFVAQCRPGDATAVHSPRLAALC
jgi:hypothetical protein